MHRSFEHKDKVISLYPHPSSGEMLRLELDGTRFAIGWTASDAPDRLIAMGWSETDPIPTPDHLSNHVGERLSEDREAIADVLAGLWEPLEDDVDSATHTGP